MDLLLDLKAAAAEIPLASFQDAPETNSRLFEQVFVLIKEQADKYFGLINIRFKNIVPKPLRAFRSHSNLTKKIAFSTLNLLAKRMANADRNSGDETMPFANRFEVLIGGKKIAAPPLTSRDSTIGNLPAVPVSAETLLRMELLARESATDLGAFSDAVLADAGATIQILRLAGQEYGTAADRPERIEDCISELGPQACLNAAAKGALFGSMPSRANSAFWVHAREAAQYFKMFAVLDGLGITPDQAYLTGLLHALGALPAVLGWERFGLHGDPARLALAIAEQWQLPRFVIDFFSEVFLPGSCPAWAKFITVAHHPAKESWLECPLVRAQGLSLRNAAGTR